MFAPRLKLLALLAALIWPSDLEVEPSYTGFLSRITLTGRVTDAGGGAPLQGAQVSIRGESLGGSTNREGVYLLVLPDRWEGREVEVVAELIGYETARQSIRLGPGTNRLDLTLTGQELEKMRMDLVQATRFRAMEAPRMAQVAGVLYRRGFPPNTESYARIEENRFRQAASDPLSTFSIDVDRASYANVRRFVNEGMRPPVDAVRIEELINYFPYSDPTPVGDAPLAIRAEVSAAPWQPLHRLVRIGLKARSVDLLEAPASNLVFLLDVSGSMASPDKLPLLKTAFRMLVGQMRPQDRVAIVVYAGAAGLVLPSTPGNEKDRILSAIEGLDAGGSTAGGAGIRLAYKVAQENHIRGGNNRVILATDGDFNVGASSDADMIRLIEEKRDQGTFLTVLGFGTGNLKDSKMEQIADHGNGNFSYIDNALEAKKVLVSEMGGTLLTVAKDVKIQVEFNPTKVAAYRLIGYENRLLADEDFNDDRKDAGEVGSGHTVTALYEVIPVGVETPVKVADLDPLRYQESGVRSDATDSPELLFVKLRYKEPDGETSELMQLAVLDEERNASEDFRFASAVAAWGMLLRDSEFCSDFTLGEVVHLARESLGSDQEGYRREFLRLVEAAQAMELLEREPGAR
jgi:Ca-activated chloride channel family protein